MQPIKRYIHRKMQRALRFYLFHLPLSPAKGQRDASTRGESMSKDSSTYYYFINPAS